MVSIKYLLLGATLASSQSCPAYSQCCATTLELVDSGPTRPPLYMLTGTCTSDGFERYTALDLNYCLTNIDGWMYDAPNGNAFYSCNLCSYLQPDLTCACADFSGYPVTAKINLDEIIGAVGGRLSCYGIAGYDI